jgi:hypothetical protein
MESTINLTIVAGLVLLLLIISGVRLRITGEPYKTAILAIHKLFTLGIIALLAIVTIQHLKVMDFGVKGIVVVFLSGLFLIIATITGAILTKEKTSKKPLKIAHKLSSALAVIMIPVIWLMCH